ncbi:hypothetical protein BC936DRAFT_139052 [Jimgerdemannia flammicorona]|uniref:Uncharacterized protein n=1 Tax=Jimgerdemannia flammicorona TaxID=994334 RepID=A0A433DI28_9FUNG|nr:hypothetical protein BC936DRAFT_139052 [Jimgerdemannia flammicorona]
MNNISIFDTVGLTWHYAMASGNILTYRVGNTTVLGTCICRRLLGADGNSVIVFGGTTDNYASYSTEVWTLDVNTFTWVKPIVKGSPPRYTFFSNDAYSTTGNGDPDTYTADHVPVRVSYLASSCLLETSKKSGGSAAEHEQARTVGVDLHCGKEARPDEGGVRGVGTVVRSGRG